MSSEKKAVDLGLLEEDDEFEEFPADGERKTVAISRGFSTKEFSHFFSPNLSCQQSNSAKPLHYDFLESRFVENS